MRPSITPGPWRAQIHGTGSKASCHHALVFVEATDPPSVGTAVCRASILVPLFSAKWVGHDIVKRLQVSSYREPRIEQLIVPFCLHRSRCRAYQATSDVRKLCDFAEWTRAVLGAYGIAAPSRRRCSLNHDLTFTTRNVSGLGTVRSRSLYK